jgi:hypothetical protein
VLEWRIDLVHRLLWSSLCVLILVTGTGCAVTTSGSTKATSAPTITPQSTATVVSGPPTPSNVPPGWQVYSGQHFTIAYPSAWATSASPPETGFSGGGIIFSNPAASPATSQVVVAEEWGYSNSQLQAICQLTGTKAILAGLSMNYTVGEGVHRNWVFIDSQGVAFTLDALDAAKSSQIQQLDDSILATFRPDDTSSGCPAT